MNHTIEMSFDRTPTDPRTIQCPHCPHLCKFKWPWDLKAHIILRHPDMSSLTITTETTPNTVFEGAGAITKWSRETQTTPDTIQIVEEPNGKKTAAEISRSMVPIFPGQEIKFQGDAGGNSSSELAGGIKEEEMQIGEHDGSYSSEAVLTVLSSSSNSALEEFDRLPQEYKDMFQDIVGSLWGL